MINQNELNFRNAARQMVIDYIDSTFIDACVRESRYLLGVAHGAIFMAYVNDNVTEEEYEYICNAVNRLEIEFLTLGV